MRLSMLCLFCLCFLFSGCAKLPSAQASDDKAENAEKPKPPPEPPLPVPTQFPVSAQFRLEAGKHWQSIAEDSARALAFGMRKHRCGPGRECRPLYVVAPEVETGFSRAFANALITALVTQGVTVANVPDAALALHIDVQSLKFGYGDKALPDTKVRSLIPNLWTTTPNPKEKTTSLAQLFPSRAAHCEIFVTLSVLDEQRYVARNSQVYYVSSDDLRLYEQRICSRLNPCDGGGTEGTPLTAPPKKGTLQIIGEPNGKKPEPQK